MIIYWSMLLWVPLVYIVYSLNRKEEVVLADYNIRNGTYNKIPMSYAIAVFGYFTFWIGMRKYVADTTQYIYSFNMLTTDFREGISNFNWESKGWGFDLFTLIFKCFISTDFQVWLIVIAIISGLCVLIPLRKYSVDFFFSSFLFIVLQHFIWPMNGMRQFVAVSLIFVFSDYLIKGNFWKYFFIIAILSTIHSSVWMMLPIYFVLRSNPWKWKTIVFIIGIVVVTMFAEPILGGAGEFFGGSGYTNVVIEGDDGVNPIRVAFYMIPPVLAFLCRNELEKYYEKYPILPVCINASIATAALYFVGMFTSGILIGRLPIYCDMYNLILIPFILHIGFDDNTKKIIKYIYVLVLIAFFYLLMDGQYYHSELTGTVL